MEQELLLDIDTLSLDALDELIGAIAERLAALDREEADGAAQAGTPA